MIGSVTTTLADTVEQVLRATESVLAGSPDEPISSTPSSVRDLLAAGEDVVAYEILCENLYEIDVRPSADLGRDLRQAPSTLEPIPRMRTCFWADSARTHIGTSGSRLLETSRRIGVWPDSVQVSGGTLSIGAAHPLRVWLSSGLRPVGHRDEAWLKRGLPCS